MKELLELIAKSLVDLPDEVEVTEVEGEQTTVLELKVAQEDLGKVIGKQGRTARSIRTIPLDGREREVPVSCRVPVGRGALPPR